MRGRTLIQMFVSFILGIVFIGVLLAGAFITATAISVWFMFFVVNEGLEMEKDNCI